jgi:hypothetical protein
MGLNLVREMVGIDRDPYNMPPYTGDGEVEQWSVVYRAQSLWAHLRERTQTLSLARSEHNPDQTPQHRCTWPSRAT